MADEREFEPRLGRIRSVGGGRGKSYLQRVLRAASLAGPARSGQSKFRGSRIGRGFGAGKVLASRDKLSAFRSRRVIIKTRIVKMRGVGAKAAALHLRYIQRDGVTQDGRAGELYGPDRDTVDAKDFLARSGEDRHQFRFIVSAEDAGDYADLKPFVRKLMARMETDLGTDLDWVAVDHHNTGHPHTHIVLRGRDNLGKDLVIARDYVAHGMRERAAEIITLDLGPRSELEIASRFDLQVGQERFTDLDRMLKRAASPENVVELSAAPVSVGHHHWAGRLQTLGRLGLAEEIAPGQWQLSPELEPTLRTMGERSDIIKTMHRDLGAKSQSRSLADLTAEPVREALIGQVVSRGLSDERAGMHYLVVDGLDGRVHYAEVAEGVDETVAAGSIVRVSPGSAQTRSSDRTIAEIARANGGTYSPELHRIHDPSAKPEFVQAHVRRLEALRRVGQIVERQPDGRWTVPPDIETKGATFDQAKAVTRVEVLSPVRLDKLATARAQTWLDKELLTDAPAPLRDTGFGHAVKDALRARRTWLVEEGLARQEAGRTVYPKDVLARLRSQELAEASAPIAASIGKAYTPASNGHVEGTCRGSLHLVSGKFAVIEKSRDFTLVPWRPVLERQLGKPVQGIMRDGNVSWSVGRSRGPTVG
jgi:type IV secretory pathway VirD2 relaxase